MQAGVLAAGRARADLAIDFMNSAEFNAGGRSIAGLYVGILGRNAEFGGWQFQRNALATGLVTQETLVGNFVNSLEYRARFGTPDNAAFIRLLYQLILLRQPSADDVAFHVSTITGPLHLTRVQVATNFLSSKEFQVGTGPQLTAFLIYAGLLLRDPYLNEFSQRIDQIHGQTPLRSIVDEIIKSPEFASTF